MDRKKILESIEDYEPYARDLPCVTIKSGLILDVISLLKEQERLLRKKQTDINKLCAEYSNLKHRFHEKTEIVRCKDCTWWGAERLCENSDSPCFQNGCTHGNWYCADGEAK